jgi:hypothetical protein
MTKLVWLAFIATAMYAQTDQKTNKENMVRDRGQTNVFRGSDPTTLSGTLIDAGCKDRSAVNVTSRPESLSGAMPAQTEAESRAAGAKSAGGASSHGITVDAKTLAAERSDVLEHQFPDLFTRQADPSCAITGSTKAFALLLSDGRLLNLDEGGNTLAGELVTMSPQGRAMLNGKAFGFKPKVTVAGRIRGDRFIASDVQVQ